MEKLFTRETVLRSAAQSLPRKQAKVREWRAEIKERLQCYVQRVDEEFEKMERELDEVQRDLSSRWPLEKTEQVACCIHHLDEVITPFFTQELSRLWSEASHQSPLEEALRSARTEDCLQCARSKEAVKATQIDMSSEVTIIDEYAEL